MTTEKPDCEKCDRPHDKTPDGSMPYSWGPGPIRWLCGKCAPNAYARYEVEREKAQPLPRESIASWLRQEARCLVTPHVRRVLIHLAKYIEEGGEIPRKT